VTYILVWFSSLVFSIAAISIYLVFWITFTDCWAFHEVGFRFNVWVWYEQFVDFFRFTDISHLDGMLRLKTRSHGMYCMSHWAEGFWWWEFIPSGIGLGSSWSRARIGIWNFKAPLGSPARLLLAESPQSMARRRQRCVGFDASCVRVQVPVLPAEKIWHCTRHIQLVELMPFLLSSVANGIIY
jgi:hypothetical protein